MSNSRFDPSNDTHMAVLIAGTSASSSAVMDMVQTNAVPSPVAQRPSARSVVKRLGRYEILRTLGQGGMGVVYHGRDIANGQEVALKVLSAGCGADSESLRRFEKEARLLDAAKSPHVANLLEVGQDGDTRFLVMEFVKGGDLRRWMRNQRVFDEPTALQIIADLCRALVTAHAKGMIHRDIKPENVLLDESAGSLLPLLKLTDFGLARHMDQSESLKMTHTGALLGTPYYMSPEQFTGNFDVSPASDVYAIGATFYELLTGQRPFTGGDAIQLASAHCFDDPVDVRKFSPLVSDATADLVNRMLAKHPGQRPQDASMVLEEVLRIQTGDSSQFVAHPFLPEHDSKRVIESCFEWELESSPESLWPFISHTDRFNHAAGLLPVKYEMIAGIDGRSHKMAQIKVAGMKIQWEEHPFEWIEGQRFSVLREFPKGPFVWFLNDVQLIRRADGGTTIRHQCKIEPRGIVGRLVMKRELGKKSQRKFDAIYRRIDRIASKKENTSRVTDAFREPAGLKRVQRQRLEQRLDQVAATDVSPAVVELFRDLILNCSDQDLARIRPLAIARGLGMAENEVIEGFLQAVPLGLWTLHWDLICPTCRLATDTKSTLRQIGEHGNCAACQCRFDVQFGSSIELVFRAHPEVRVSDSKTYCAGGPGNFPHVVSQVRLKPGERLMLPLMLDSGSFVVRGANLPYAVPIRIDSKAVVRHGQVRLLPGMNRSPVIALQSGHQNLVVENDFPCEQVIRVERSLGRSDALTAADVATMPLFRSLFPDQTLSPGQLVEIATSNFLAIRLDGFDELFSELGDAATHELMQNFLRIVERQTLQRGGVVVNRSAEMMMVSFSDPVAAIDTFQRYETALQIEKPDRKWSVSGGLHRGPALVTGDREEIRYFGGTINRTIQLARHAEARRLLLTHDIWADPDVSATYGKLMRPFQLVSVLGDEVIKVL